VNAFPEWKEIDSAPNGQRVQLWDSWNGLFSNGSVHFDGNGGYTVHTDIDRAFRATHWAFVIGPQKSQSLPQYREPTIEDARELLDIAWALRAEQLLPALKQLGFVRKVQP